MKRSQSYHYACIYLCCCCCYHNLLLVKAIHATIKVLQLTMKPPMVAMALISIHNYVYACLCMLLSALYHLAMIYVYSGVIYGGTCMRTLGGPWGDPERIPDVCARMCMCIYVADFYYNIAATLTVCPCLGSWNQICHPLLEI